MRKITFKKILWLSFTLSLLAIAAIFIHYYKYRYIPLVIIGTKDQIKIKPLEVYTDQLSYQIGDTIFIQIKTDKPGKGQLIRTKSGLNEKYFDSFTFEIQNQLIQLDQSKNGCQWTCSDTIIITENHPSGYYKINLNTKTDTSSFNFIIENRKSSKIAVLAPTSTWVAYNNWGGQSLYHNYIGDKTTYYVSSLRPDPNNDIRIEAHSTNYFLDNYNSILLPDYALEYDIELLKNVDIIILNYHAEYFSEKMYNNLVSLLEDEGISLISLGGNQMYWKTEWNSQYTVMECRKDLTSFDNHILNYGGMWRHHFGKAEHHILGVQFTEAGMHSYAPYEVKNANHWIFDSTNVKSGDLFGFYGIDENPLSGDETDKVVQYSEDIVVLAKGLNCTDKNPLDGLDDNCMGNDGGDFILKTTPNYSVLSTGSIQSGSGLAIDTVFTTMIKNYINHEINNSK